MFNKIKLFANSETKPFTKICLVTGFILLTALILFTVCLAVYFIMMITVPKSSTNSFFNKLKIESTSKPSFAYDDSVYFDDETVNLGSYLTEEQDLMQVFANDNGVIYFAFESWQNNDCIWNIAKVDTTEEQMQVLCSKSFLNARYDVYTIYHGNDYCERNGYYLDGKIVLTDHSEVLEYTIADNSYTISDVADYQFPSLEIEHEIVDSETIRFKASDCKKILRLSDAVNDSKSLGKIYTLKDKKVWDKESYLHDFFTKIETVGNKVYILCTVYNYAGESYVVILDYNIESNSCDYAGYCFTGDKWDDSFSIIFG